MTDLRRSLLGTSYRLFTNASYQGTSIRAIADRCSCNVASVHYYFGFVVMARQLPGEEAPDQVCETLLYAALRRDDPKGSGGRE